MAAFDMDEYLANRFNASNTSKIDDIIAARNAKIAQLDRFNSAVAANSATQLAVQQAEQESWVGQLGLDLQSIPGSAVNLAASAYSGVSTNIAGPLAGLPKAIESAYYSATLDAKDTEAFNRYLQGKASPEDQALLGQKEVAPGEFLNQEDYAAAVAQGARDRGNSKLELFNKALAARTASSNVVSAFDRSSTIHQGNRRPMDAAFADGSQFALDETKAGWQDLKDGNIADGVGNITAGVAQLLVHAGKVAAGNKMAALEYVTENAPQLLLGALGKAGASAQVLSNVGYASDTYQKGMENFLSKNGVLPSTEEQNTMAWQAAQLALSEQAGDTVGVGVMKGRKALAGVTGQAEASLSREGFLASLKGVSKAAASGVASEAPTEGYQTHLEGEILGKPATALDIYKGAAIGGISGGVLSGGGRTVSEMTGTTPEHADRVATVAKKKVDLEERTKTNNTADLLDSTASTYDPVAAAQVMMGHAQLADTTPEVKAENLAKVREVTALTEESHKRNVSLLDMATDPDTVSGLPDQIASKKADLAATDPTNTTMVDVLTKQIALREDALALAGDKKNLKRLEYSTNKVEQDLKKLKSVQENFADQNRVSVPESDVLAHITKVTSARTSDNMPDSDIRASADVLMRLAREVPDSITVDMAQKLYSSQHSTLSSEEKDYFRQFSEARIKSNELMNLSTVSKAVFTGSERDKGIAEYRSDLAQAYEAKDKKTASREMEALTNFEASHIAKAAIAADLFKNVQVGGDRQVLRTKFGDWEVRKQGKPLSKSDLKKNGGFEIHPNSGVFVANLQKEAAALSAVVKEQTAAYALTFGSKVVPASVASVSPIASVASTPTTQATPSSVVTAPSAETTTPVGSPTEKQVVTESVPEHANAAGTYRDGGKWSAIYKPVTRGDGSVVLTRVFTDSDGPRVEYLSQNGEWTKGTPSTITVSGVAQIAGPETFLSVADAIASARTENGVEGTPTAPAQSAPSTTPPGVHSAPIPPAVSAPSLSIDKKEKSKDEARPEKNSELSSEKPTSTQEPVVVAAVPTEAQPKAGTEGETTTAEQGPLPWETDAEYADRISTPAEIQQVVTNAASEEAAFEAAVFAATGTEEASAFLASYSELTQQDNTHGDTQTTQAQNGPLTPVAGVNGSLAKAPAGKATGSNRVNEKAAGAAQDSQTSEVTADLLKSLDAVTTGVSSVGTAKFVANAEQADGIAKIKAFLAAPNKRGTQGKVLNNVFVLEGKAGTGKTSLVQEAVAGHLSKGNTVTVAAISHKAKSLLENKLNAFTAQLKSKLTPNEVSAGKKIGTVNALSIAALLGMKMNVETGEFFMDLQAEKEPPIAGVSILVVDEASMVSVGGLVLILEKLPSTAKLIILGDRNQIAPIEKDPALQGKISPVFSMDTGVHKASLVTRVRQGEDSTILPYADHYWDNAEGNNSVANPVPAAARKSTSELIMLPAKNWVASVIPLFQRALASGNANLVKVVAYNNLRNGAAGAAKLLEAEHTIRTAMFGKKLQDYNIGEQMMMDDGFGNPKEGGIENSTELVVTASIADTKTVRTVVGVAVSLPYFVVTAKDVNTGKVHTLPLIANSARTEFASILLGYEKAAKGAQAKTKESAVAWAKYYAMKGKVFAPANYAYIITAHKSQGSTYDVAVILEDNIQGNRDGNANVSRMMYTALTRASKLAVVVSSKNPTGDTTQQNQNTQEDGVPQDMPEDIPFNEDGWDYGSGTEDTTPFDRESGSAQDSQTSGVSTTDLIRQLQAKYEDRTFRELTETEANLLQAAQERLKELFTAPEVRKITFVVQENLKGINGTAYGEFPVIGLDPSVFTRVPKRDDALDYSLAQRMDRILAHEIAHMRDRSVNYASERSAALQPDGVVYQEIQAAIPDITKNTLTSKAYSVYAWFNHIINNTDNAVRVPRELYAQLHALHYANPELLNEILPISAGFFSRNNQAHQARVAKRQSLLDGAGSTESGGKPTATGDSSTAGGQPRSEGTAGGTATEAPPAGTLKALLVSPDPKGTPYNERNLLAGYFTQVAGGITAASKRPLVMVQDFLSSIGSTTQFFTFLAQDETTDAQLLVLSNFKTLATEWQPLVNSGLVKGDNGAGYAKLSEKDKKRFLYRNPLNWLMEADSTGKVLLEENVTTAITYGALTLLQELAGDTPHNTQKQINAILGRGEDAILPTYADTLLGTVGTRNHLKRNSTGQTITDALGLKAKDQAGLNLMTQLQGVLGIHAERVLLQQSLLVEDRKTLGEINRVNNLINILEDAGKPLLDEKAKGEDQVFLRIARDADGRPTQAVRDLLEKFKGSNGVVDKLFSVENHMVYPSLQPQEFTQKTTKPGQKVPGLLAEVLQQNGQQPTYAREDFWKVLGAVSNPVLDTLAGVVPVDKASTHVSQRLGLSAKNEATKRDLDRYVEFVTGSMTDEEDNLNGTAIYLPYDVQVQQRVGEASNMINQQGSKVHRPLFYRDTKTAGSWKATVDLTDPDSVNNFELRIAEAFNIKTERGVEQTALDLIATKLKSKEVVAAIKAIRGVLYEGKTEFTPAEEADLVEATAQGKNQLESLGALLALAHKQQAEAKGETTFETILHASVDGVANGVFLATLTFGAADTVEGMNAIAARGGAYTGGTDETYQSFGEYKNAGTWNQDNYEYNANTVVDAIAKAVAKENGVVAQAVSFFTGSLGTSGNIASAGRDALKPPVTQMMYGSGIKTTLGIMAAGFLGTVYETFLQAELRAEKDPAYKVEVVRQINVLLEANKSSRVVKITEDLREVQFDATQEVSAVTKGYLSVYKAPVTTAIARNFALFKQRTTMFNQAVQLADGLYTSVFAALKRQALAQLKDVPTEFVKERDEFGNELQGRFPVRDLTGKETKRIEQQLETLFPTMRTLLSIESSEDEAEQYAAGIRLGKVTKTISMKPAFTSKVNFKEAGQAGEQKTVRGYESGYEDPSVRMLPILTQSIESYIAHMTQKGRALGNTHDSVHGGLDTIHEATRAINQHTFNAVMRFSPLKEAHNTLARSVAGLATLIRQYEDQMQEYVDTNTTHFSSYATLQAEQAMVLKAVENFLDDFANKNTIADVDGEPVYGSNVLADALQALKGHAVATDTVKLNSQKQWAYVGQYALEHNEARQSSYEVTEEDQAALDAMLMTVEDWGKEVDPGLQSDLEDVAYGLRQTGKPVAVPTKKFGSDNMPDTDTTVPSHNLSTMDIAQALPKGGISEAFDGHLTQLLSNIVAKLHGTYGSFKASLMEATPKSAFDTYAEALVTGKADYAFGLNAAGFVFSDRQAFVADQVHATILEALNGKDGRSSAVYSELSKLFMETSQRLSPQSFYKEDWATASVAEQAEATALYNRVFKDLPPDIAGKSNALANFAALGLTHEGFNDLLKVPTARAPDVLKDKTLSGVLMRLFGKILEFFNGKLTETRPGQQADVKLQALVTKLVTIETSRLAALNAPQSDFMRLMDKQAQSWRMTKKGAVSKMAHSKLFMKNKNVFIASGSAVLATLADSQVGLFFKNWEVMRAKYFEGIPGIAGGFLAEMNGPKPKIQGMLRAVKHFEKLRKVMINHTSKFVRQSMDNQGKDMDRNDRQALTHTLLHSGAHVLLDGNKYSTQQLETMLRDGTELDKAIAAEKQGLTQFSPAIRAHFIEQSKALGFWLITGRATHEKMMKNAHNIAHGFESVHQGMLTREESELAAPIIDRLVSLYAMQYTTAGDKTSAIKTLEKEHARTDGGNGVRVVLLSHKEMEKQALGRIFNDNPVLMQKGYMPEIYNPYTDLQAATAEEGKALVARGYQEGAKVEADPSDPNPEAKRLYLLRDGGKLSWLSGIMSFTGMQAKGTAGHNKYDYQAHQAIAKGKQDAIDARSASQSGENFEPSKVASSHMVPLLNGSGVATSYQYLMHTSTKALLERDTQFDAVLGALNGSIYDKEQSAVNNRKAIELFHEDFKAGFTKEPAAYLKVSASSKEPELREIYRMLSHASKSDIKAIWGKDEMMIRSNHLDIAFGYRKRSLSTAFEKDAEDRNFMEQQFVNWLESTLAWYGRNRKKMSKTEAEQYAKRAAVYVRRSENVWQALVKETKDIFVVKSGITALNNIASNQVLLKLYGVPLLPGLKDMRIAWVSSQEYTTDTERLFMLEGALAAGSAKNMAQTKLEIAQIKERIGRNPVRPLIDAGLMATISEDLEDEDQFAFKAQFTKMTEKYTNQLNKYVVIGGKQVYMTHDTQTYKAMANITQMSDFVARYALFQHLTTRKENPIAEKFALQEVSDAFINYDVPMNRDLQYLDDMGLMMFTKYFVRIQRVIRGRFKHAPGKVAMLLLAQGYLDWLPSPLDASILFKFGNNPLSLGALQFPGSIDELMPVKAGLSLFK